MERKRLELSSDKMADQINQINRQTHTTPFPKDPKRWLSHYVFEPRPITFTCEGEVEGGLSLPAASLFDLSFARSLFARYYSREGATVLIPQVFSFFNWPPGLTATPPSVSLNVFHSVFGALP